MSRCMLIVVFALSLCSCSLDRFGGASKFQPEDIENLSVDAQRLIQAAIKGIDPARFVDYHAHALCTGNAVSACYLGEPLTKSMSGRLMAKFYKSGAGIIDDENADQQFVSRLINLLDHSGLNGKTHLLAYDQSYLADGTVDSTATMFYVPNEYVYQLGQDYPDHFVPVISLHPNNPSAIDEIHRWGRLGVRFLKWSAPMMEISPGDESVESFYLAMKKYDMVLLSHGGPYSLASEESQHFGNPQYLLFPLSLGVKVIVAHSASGGECIDIEMDGASPVSCFDLFVRMLENPDYEGLLFGDISAILNSSHLGEPLRYLLSHPELHKRLIYGSDYPGPAINIVINTSDLVKSSFVTEQEQLLLNEIYDYNPLLFDFVMQRTVKHPDTGARFSDSMFQKNEML